MIFELDQSVRVSGKELVISYQSWGSMRNMEEPNMFSVDFGNEISLKLRHGNVEKRAFVDLQRTNDKLLCKQ